MFSPSFQCSPDGLRSAVRLRYAVQGARDPEAAAAEYMSTVSDRVTSDPAWMRGLIELVIRDIERLSSAPVS